MEEYHSMREEEIKDALAYIRVVLDPMQDFFLKRIINVPKRSIGMVSVQKIETKARELGVPMFDAIPYTDLTPAARQSLFDFRKMIQDMQEKFDTMENLAEIMPYLMGKTGYIDMLRAEDDEIADDRIDNLKELQNVFTRGDEYYEGTFMEKTYTTIRPDCFIF